MDYVILRGLCSFLCGAMISQAGSLMQISTRNILASPSTLGFDGLAVLWVLIVHSVLISLNISGPWTFVVGIPVFVLFGLVFSHHMRAQKNYDRLLLIGITFNLAVGAIFSLWQFLFLAFNLSFPNELWFGHFRFVERFHLIQLLIIEFVFLIGLSKLWSDLRLFTLGRTLALQMGLQERKLLTLMFVFIALSTFAIVSAFGAFSFLGLVFPIVARWFWFKKYDLKGELLIGSLINGFIFMFIDWLCYEFPLLGAEIPVGLIITGVGALSLIFILWKSSVRETLAKPKK